MTQTVVLLAASIALLCVGAEALVRGSVALAKRMGVSSFFIGLTIVGFGTSTPELATGVAAALQGLDDMNVGNVVGSNIFNICLILGITALIAPIPVNTRLVRAEVLVVIAVALVPYLALLSDGQVARWQGAALCVGLCVYVWRGYRAGKLERETPVDQAARELDRELAIERPRWHTSLPANLVQIAVGLGFLVVGSRFLIASATEIARTLGVSELAIALTVVAGGTSAPELVTSLVAAVRKQADISVGNILGSNVFNLLGILGLTSLIEPQRVSPQVFWLDAPLMIAASVACLPIMLSQHRISRREGALLLVAYVAYLCVLFVVVPGWFS